jgi:hypothetical protein
MAGGAMRRALVCLLPLGVVACTFTVGIKRESKTAAAVPVHVPAPPRAPDAAMVIVAEYETELTAQCNAQFVAMETCAEQRRLILAFRQSPDKRAAFAALNDHAGEVEHPAARRALLAILARLGLALERE